MSSEDRPHLPVPAFLRLQQLRAAAAADASAGAPRQPLGERCGNLQPPPPRPHAAPSAAKVAASATDGGAPASSMQRRNQRERNRVKLLNLGFERLRQLVPSEDGQRLSKIGTLRAAIAYIRSLQEVLDDDDGGSGGDGGDSWQPPSESPMQVEAAEPPGSQQRLCSTHFGP